MLNQLQTRILAVSVTVTLLAAVGCSPRPLPVEGRLLWDDGKPVSGASVRFVPASGTIEAIGVTNKEGAFTLSSGGTTGAFPGEYKVVVFKGPGGVDYKGGEATTPEDMRNAMKGMMKKGPGKIMDPIPDSYATPEKTPLTCKVDAQNLKPELKISRK
jgi:hypothetical protein